MLVDVCKKVQGMHRKGWKGPNCAHRRRGAWGLWLGEAKAKVQKSALADQGPLEIHLESSRQGSLLHDCIAHGQQVNMCIGAACAGQGHLPS